MVTTYKLVYFNLRALGEPIRMMFQYMSIPYEDVRIDPADWSNVKNDYKWRQVPELYVTRPDKSFMLTQTAGICRYLANSHPEFDLMPGDALYRARCDQVVDVVQDLRIQIKPYIVAKYYTPGITPSQLDLLKDQLFADNFILFLSNLNTILSEEPQTPFISRNGLAWADFFLANFTSIWESVLQTTPQDKLLLSAYPALKRQQLAVKDLPQIKQWISKRPISHF